MKIKIICLTALAVLLCHLFPSIAAAMAETRAYFPPVLVYHDVKPVPTNYFDVTPEDLGAQLDWLRHEGYVTLSLEEFAHIVSEERKFPDKSILITFDDDGHRGIYDYAVPELKKRKMHATFFIMSDLVTKDDDKDKHINRQELKKLADNSLFSIGSHTMTHPFLNLIVPDEQQREIADSRRILAEYTSCDIISLSFPYGAYDQNVIRAVQKAGYAMSFAIQDHGRLHEPARYSIPRIYMGLKLGKDNLEEFAEYVRTYRHMPAAAFAERWEPIEKITFESKEYDQKAK